MLIPGIEKTKGKESQRTNWGEIEKTKRKESQRTKRAEIDKTKRKESQKTKRGDHLIDLLKASQHASFRQ